MLHSCKSHTGGRVVSVPEHPSQASRGTHMARALVNTTSATFRRRTCSCAGILLASDGLPLDVTLPASQE
eukprot:766987-Hanusia_phi.AAC.1